ncbi:MAG: hypothetical protein Q4G16_12570, partial [Cruoricaptor ignavus]|nr:hypothetical protein [Cruoricaptor ignavus]
MNTKQTILLLCFFILSLGMLNAQKQNADIRILYFNDAHELNPVKTEVGNIGGVSRMKTVIDEVKKQSPDAIVIFGGDLGGGTLGGKLFRGSVMVESFNAFPVDYANFGQHEFDYGLGNAINLVEKSQFKWFTSNIVQQNGNSIPKTFPYIIHKKNGKTIGIIGITDKISTTKPSAGVKQLDLIESAKTAIKALGKVDVLVAVTQMAMPLNQELIDACPEINLVLSEETSQYKTQVDYYK